MQKHIALWNTHIKLLPTNQYPRILPTDIQKFSTINGHLVPLNNTVVRSL